MNHTGPALRRGEFLKLAGAAAAAATIPFAVGAADAVDLLSRVIPKSSSGEQLPVIGLGTYDAFGSRGDAAAMDEKVKVVRTLIEGGGAVIDTAEAYAESQALCGEILEKLGARAKAFISTKIWQTGEENGRAAVERAIKKLRVSTIDLMHVHNMVDAAVHLPMLEDYKAQGRFRYIGMSHSTPGVQDGLTDWMATGRLDFVEFNYSVDVRGPEQRLLPMAADKGVGVLVAMPFGSGGLIRAMTGREVPEWAREELGCTSHAQMLLKFVVSHPAVTAAIPRTSQSRHMADNIKAGTGPIPNAKQRDRLAAVWEDA
jgi:diketogulonate reductase-like aldo/keto reductase